MAFSVMVPPVGAGEVPVRCVVVLTGATLNLRATGTASNQLASPFWCAVTVHVPFSFHDVHLVGHDGAHGS